MKKLLIIGTGSIGERHTRCFLATGRVQVSICEPNDTLRERIARDYTVEAAFPDLDSALEKDWDAALVATPAHTHIPIAQQLADKGIHLFIEKPLSTSLDGIGDLQKTVVDQQLLAAVAYVWRCFPGIEWLKSVVEDRRFGALKQLTILSGQNFPFYRPAYREIYYTDRAKGGGAIQDCLTHLLNFSEFLAGPITRIVADSDHQVLEGVEVEDTVHVIARHGETMGCYSLNQYQAPNETTVTLVFEKGTARFEHHENHCRWMTEPGAAWNDVELPAMERDDLFIRQANAFLDALEGKSEPLCTLDEALGTLK
ncbi:MAG: Gfo/Idh/MocA family oxidoreductase, partial [Candidatus Omnitrophica bacterium]|nr:Gfo/Idh/MocA family oxidoreductase [Candidatus Omnitrophota bacterium]